MGLLDMFTARPASPTHARALTLTPRPYQHEGIAFLRTQKRAMIGDAPGLGKTLQASEAAVLPAVVCCPVTLAEQWAEFLATEYPDDPVAVACYGDPLKRDAQLKAFERDGGWLIVNHDMLSKYYLPDAETLIIDEMHHFRREDSVRARGMRMYAQRVPRLYGLTATPVYKDISDLWHQLHLLDPVKWSSYWGFITKYAVTSNTGWGLSVVRRRNIEELDRNLKPYLLQRTYKDVGMYLPQRINKNVILRMDDAQRKTYTKLRDFYRLELEDQDAKRFYNAGAVLHELRKLTITPQKIAAIEEIIDDTPGDTPIIVFCWYQATAAVLSEALAGEKITGALNPTTRRHRARHTDKRVRVITLESLAEGVDLSQARTVIYAEESYLPGQMYQAISRVLRFTKTAQVDPVVIYSVRHANTVDETVHHRAQLRTTSSALAVLKEALGV